jgi:ribosomal protein S18 acetylase RimI-like enzyme
MLTAPHPLDNPVRTSLTGPHARFAERRGAVLRYPADVCPFLALPDQPSAADWADAAALVGPGGLLPLAAVKTPPPAGWAVEFLGEGVQLTEMGRYLGIRRDGMLVAMAGERLHPPGWTEISAVCTDAAWRGRGLASRLVLAVTAGIRARGETPFLHAVSANVNAIRLYEELGFRLRKSTVFSATRIPEAAAAGRPQG